MAILKVSSTSKPSSVAGALANNLKQGESVELQAIGAGAINQAIKAVAIARGFVAPSGKDLSVVPGFVDVKIGEEEKTAIKLYVKINN